jgi:ATP-binding cassette subfamily E protein 1
LGLLGRNGIGKSTAIKLLAGVEKINLGEESASWEELKEFFKGNEILKYLENLDSKKISYKPQNLSQLSVDVKVMDLLLKRGEKEKIMEFAKKLNLTQVLDNKMNKLSGGELQRVAILAASLGESEVYFFDEPLAFLDISERLRVSDFIKEISEGKVLVVVEHDLLILDYLTDYLNIFFGGQGSYGIVSGLKSSKEGVNAYLHGFLKEENMKIRDKELNFNFTKNQELSGYGIGKWPDFNIKFDSGFNLDIKGGEIKQNHVVGILGKNGTGKTSFVKALAGEIETSKGKLDLDLKISYKKQYLFTEEDVLVRDICFKEKIGKKMKSIFYFPKHPN